MTVVSDRHDGAPGEAERHGRIIDVPLEPDPVAMILPHGLGASRGCRSLRRQDARDDWLQSVLEGIPEFLR